MKVGSVLAGCALRHPQREALVCGEHRITFAELDRATDDAARALRERGVRTGDRVIVALENGPAWIEAFYAIAKLGAIAVPVNTRLAGPELAHVVADCDPAGIVAAPSHRGIAAAAFDGRTYVSIECEPSDRLCPRPAAGDEPLPPPVTNAEPLPPLPTAADDILICYTSGTTGTPKGAVLTHTNLLVMAFMNDVDWRLTPEDRILITTPLAHRTAIARLLNALSLGATLVVMPRFDAVDVLDTIARERVTVAGMVPTIARLLLPEIERDASRCATLRVVLATGEAFPVAEKERLLRALPHLRLYSFLAMTEAGSLTTLEPEEQVAHAGSVGRPTTGVEIRLVDDAGADVARGEVGEIIARCGEPGKGITMRAYYRRPEESAQTLRDGWLHTGDLGRFDADGFLYVVDRKKDMILSGGLNIYSKEVERALLAHPAVADAAVIGIPDSVYGEAVAAFVELKPGKAASEPELIEHCRTLIASYKKPRTLRIVDALPRSPVGKVLKARLRELAATR